MQKNKKVNKLIAPKIYRVTDNCTVNLKSALVGEVKKVRISKINGYDRYAFLIGKTKGSIVSVDGICWIIGYIEYDRKKKTHRRKYSAMSHPLNNKVHFLK